MITLPAKLRKNGFNYTLVSRGERACIYEQRVNEKRKDFEVFNVQISPEKEIFGKVLPKREKFPGNEAFGKTAWTYRTLDEAKEKFNEIESENK